MPLTKIDPSMTEGLLKIANNLSELAESAEAQELAMANVGISYAVPTGSVIAWSKNIVPIGYLVCNGQAVSRLQYSELFNLIGTSFGSGNGTTTFNVPNITAGFTVSSGTLYYLIRYGNDSGIAPA